MKTMTKAELVEEVARASELNKRDAEVIVETVFNSIISALHRGDKVELRGFGSFRTRERGPRRGRNPKTGAPVDVPAKRVPYFKPGKELKEFFTDGDTAPESAPTPESAATSEPVATHQPAAPAEPAVASEPAATPAPATETTPEASSAAEPAKETPETGSGESSASQA
jgi:integration host factor subunit beta